jgi:hypothetical protein
MLQALCDHLLEKPELYLGEMALFLWDDFYIQATKSSISRALASKRWSKKAARVKARERNHDLRDENSHFISDFRSYHLVYVDESGCDKRIGSRRTGWSPLGVTPVQVSKFHRDQRYQILPAYAQNGIFSLECSKARLMRPSLRVSLSNCSAIVGNGPSQSLC